MEETRTTVVEQEEMGMMETADNFLVEELFAELTPDGMFYVKMQESDEGIWLIPDESVVTDTRLFVGAYDNFHDISYDYQEITEIGGVLCSDLSSMAKAIMDGGRSKVIRLCMGMVIDDNIEIRYLKLREAEQIRDYQETNSMLWPLHEEKNRNAMLYYSRGNVLSISILNDIAYQKYTFPKLVSAVSDDLMVVFDFHIPLYLSRNELQFTLSDKKDQYIICDLRQTEENVATRTGLRKAYRALCPNEFFVCDKKYDCNINTGEQNSQIILSDEGNIYVRLQNAQGESFINIVKNQNAVMSISVSDSHYRYMVSIVMAVYNTEPFLEEAIESLLAQKTDKLDKMPGRDIYEDIYQLILVDDGSTDASGEICDRYAEEYDHIQVIHKENGGVSSARNRGIEVAEGKYINFMDSDDKFSNNVIEECIMFFEKHEKETDIICFPIRFFDAANSVHWTNYKFKNANSRVANLMDEWELPQYFVNSSFYITEKVKGIVKFDELVGNGEDIKFIYTVLCQGRPKIGLVNSCEYYYRRRSQGEPSAIDISSKTANHYIPYLDKVMEPILLLAKSQYGFIPKYVQYAVMGQLQWRLKLDTKLETAASIIGEKGCKQYKEKYLKLLEYIDCDVIAAQKKIFREHIFYLLSKKTGKEPYRLYDKGNVRYYFGDISCSDLKTTYVRLEFMEIVNNTLILEGYNCCMEPNSRTFVVVNGEKFNVIEKLDRELGGYGMGDIILYQEPFRFEFQLAESVDLNDLIEYRIQIGMTSHEYDVIKTTIRITKFVPLGSTWKKSYCIYDKWGIRLENNTLVVKNIRSTEDIEKYEKELVDEIKNNKKVKIDSKAKDVEKEKAKELLDAISLREEVRSFKLARRMTGNTKQIWLLSDRISMAGDNGEALFLYLKENADDAVEIYFAVDQKSGDFKHLTQFGKVIDYSSHEHMVIHMLADCIISSHADEHVINPYWKNTDISDMFRDMLNQKHYVFLQHGVIKDDLSNWLNKYKKNIDGFITAAKPEYKSILEYPYYYTEKEVWLTGLPRHDRLYHDEKKYITIMPTWRMYLSVDNGLSGERGLIDDFTDSTFFKFYNALLSNRFLVDEIERYGYKMCFMPHPILMDHLDLFNHDERVLLFGKDKPYREIYAESNLVITDYSSSIMDFAYLRKPVLYCQFDQEEFFAGDHIYVKGYFDYEKDGFGEVTYDIDSLMEQLLLYLRTGCHLKEKYKKRIDNFFAYNDKNNCERVCKKLFELNNISV